MQLISKLVIVTIVLAIGFPSTLLAQKKKSFSGTVTFEIQYPSTGNETADLLLERPTEYTIKISGNKLKSEISYGGFYLTEIIDGDGKTKIVLLESAANEGSYFKDTQEEIEEEFEYLEEPEVELLDETMEICGYVCKKAKVTTTNEYDEVITAIIYYTDELGSRELNFNTDYRTIDGFILRYETPDKDGKITIEVAKEVKKEKIKDFEFFIPANYEAVSAEEKLAIKKWLKGDE